MEAKVDKSFDQLGAALERYKSVVQHLVDELEDDHCISCLSHPDLTKIEATVVPLSVDLSSPVKKVVVVLKGRWTFVNGTYSKELEENDMVTVPPRVPARVETEVLGARCCYFEDNG